jgi:FKBP-type peptidyl-prolyl cis-trans isomerase SlyD
VKVAAQKVVSIDYTLTDEAGAVLDSSKGREPLAYLHGAGNIVPGLETALEGQEIGANVEVTVPPETGYGEFREGQSQRVQVRRLPKGGVQVGMAVNIDTKDGPRTMFVTGVRGDYATLDANHPLAGRTLHFKVSVVAVREPSAEELAHGHVHSPGGHEH